MPVYNFRAKNKAGKMVDSEIKMDSIDALKLHLKEKGYIVVDIQEKKMILKELGFLKPRVNLKDLALFCRQFAIILQAGVPIATALDVLRVQAPNQTLKIVLDDVFESMQKGIPLSAAMKHHKKVFPELLYNMVEAGELTGQLEDVFSRMAENYEKESKLNSKIKGSLSYPIIVTIVAIAVIGVLMVKVVPSFVKILDSFKVEMPPMTSALISISDFFIAYWIHLFVAVILAIIGVKSIIKTEGGRAYLHALSLKIPVIGGLINRIITARFTRTLSVLLASGVLLIQSMEIVQKIIGNSVVQGKLDEVISEVKKGKGLFIPINNMKFFPPMVNSMVKIGEESGELDFALAKCADYYEQEVETKLQSVTSLIEPAVMIVMAGVVGFIVLSILTPMFSIYNSM
jgi:type IV pilus assembly protein PilC